MSSRQKSRKINFEDPKAPVFVPHPVPRGGRSPGTSGCLRYRVTLSPGAKGFHHITTGPLLLPPLAAALHRSTSVAARPVRSHHSATPSRNPSASTPLCTSRPPPQRRPPVPCAPPAGHPLRAADPVRARASLRASPRRRSRSRSCAGKATPSRFHLTSPRFAHPPWPRPRARKALPCLRVVSVVAGCFEQCRSSSCSA